MRKSCFIDLVTGQRLWELARDSAFGPYYEIVYNDENYIYVQKDENSTFGGEVSRRSPKTGEIVAECPMIKFPIPYEIEQQQIETALNDLFARTIEDQLIFAESSFLGDIYRIPLCSDQPISKAEAVSEIVDRYLIPTLLYAHISPYEWVGEVYENYFLFQKEDSLLKVPVPEESFTYLYHNKKDNSVYTSPLFADLDPTSYEVVPNISGKLLEASTTRLTNGLISLHYEGGMLQVIDFNTLETLFKSQISYERWYSDTIMGDDILVITATNNSSQEITAFKLNR